jgi:hypothetical protein
VMTRRPTATFAANRSCRASLEPPGLCRLLVEVVAVVSRRVPTEAFDAGEVSLNATSEALTPATSTTLARAVRRRRRSVRRRRARARSACGGRSNAFSANVVESASERIVNDTDG